jgi:hypothetical protein
MNLTNPWTWLFGASDAEQGVGFGKEPPRFFQVLMKTCCWTPAIEPPRNAHFRKNIAKAQILFK